MTELWSLGEHQLREQIQKKNQRELWGERGTTREITQGMDFSSPSPTAQGPIGQHLAIIPGREDAECYFQVPGNIHLMTNKRR